MFLYVLISFSCDLFKKKKQQQTIECSVPCSDNTIVKTTAGGHRFFGSLHMEGGGGGGGGDAEWDIFKN